MSLVQLERRFSSPVHILTPPDIQIPVYIRAHLAKGGKFISDIKQSSVWQVISEASSFETTLRKAVFFQGRPLASSKPKRCRLRSAWTPPEHPQISLYVRLLKRELEHYVPKPIKRNEDFIDVAARRWLAQNKHAACIDGDNNLGDAIVSRQWLQTECLRVYEFLQKLRHQWMTGRSQ